MTQNRVNDFKEIVEYSNKYFDGLIYVDHFSTDGTYELLEANKKAGKIIQRPYYKQHSHSQNEILFCRHIKSFDWVFLNDSSERILPKWLDTMKADISKYEKDGVGGVHFSGRPYLWQYFDNQQFMGSPHWGVQGLVGNQISFGEENKKLYIQNNRDLNRLEHYVMHPIIYWYCHNPSNETASVYSKYGTEMFNEFEILRQFFRRYCECYLNLSVDSLDDLVNYMMKIKERKIIPDPIFIESVEKEFRLSELFQIKALGLTLEELVKNRYKFSFKDWLSGGTGFPENYKGTIIELNNKFGFPND